MMAALGAADLDQLHFALSLLLAPLDQPSPAVWRRRVSETLQALMGADGACIRLQLPGEPMDIGVGQWREQAQSAMDVYTGRYFGQSSADVRRQEVGARVWTQAAVWPKAERERSDFGTGHTGRCRPNKNFDSLGMSAPYPGHAAGEAAALITAGSPDRFVPGGREEQLLKLLQPAFAASVGMLVLVSVPRSPAASPTGAELQVRFHLTPRETEVMLLLVQGARDRAISDNLGIRLSTTRHHVEHVLAKLGIQARAAVAARIRDK